jgi:hypothetical protein
MNVPVISMSAFEARKKWLEYSRAVRERRSAEDVALRSAYRYLSMGKRVLQLDEAIKAGGLDALKRPKLAVARLTWTRCCFGYRWGDHSAGFGPTTPDAENGTQRRYSKRSLGLAPGVFEFPAVAERDRARASSVVPTVPPQFRPAGNLDSYVILFEPVWKTVPNPDPILLKEIGRGLFLVCACLDMTPLERSILFARG